MGLKREHYSPKRKGDPHCSKIFMWNNITSKYPKIIDKVSSKCLVTLYYFNELERKNITSEVKHFI